MESFRPSSHAPTLTAGLLTGLESLINDAIQMDAASMQKIKKLGEQWVQFTVEPFGETVFVCISDPIRLSTALAGKPDVAISGSPVALLRFFRHAEASNRLTITGQWSLAAQLAEISKNLEFDWESKLAELTGNLPAHFMGDKVRQALHWLSYTQQHFFRDAEEYIHHETALLPDKEEVKLWQQDITALVIATEQAEQRLLKLENSLAKYSTTPNQLEWTTQPEEGHFHTSDPNRNKED